MAQNMDMTFSSTESSPDPLSKSIDRLYPPSSPLKRLQDAVDVRGGSPNIILEMSPSKSRRISPSKSIDFSMREQRQSIVLQSPSRSIEGTGTKGSSPWKIRVIVEAEPEEQGGYDNEFQSRTITVPLKGENEHNKVRRRVKTRLGTSLTSQAKTLATRVETMPDAFSALRKTAPHSGVDNDRLFVVERQGLESDIAAPTVEGAGNTPSKRRGRPKKLLEPMRDTISSPENIQAIPALPRRITRMNFTALTPLHQKIENAHLLDSSALLTPATHKRAKVVAASRKIRDRVPTPRKPAGYDEETLSPLPPSSPNILVQESHIDNHLPANDVVLDDIQVDEASYSSEAELVDIDEDNNMTGLEDDTTFLDRSAVENEGFSMVSIDSLRNQRVTAEKRLTTTRSLVPQDQPASPQKVVTKTTIIRRRVTRLSRRSPNSVEITPDIHSLPSLDAPASLKPISEEGQQPHINLESISRNPQAMPVQNENIVTLVDGEKLSTEINHINQPHDSPSFGILPTRKYPIRKPQSSTKKKQTAEVFAPFGEGSKRQLRAGLAMGEFLAQAENRIVPDSLLQTTNDINVPTQDVSAAEMQSHIYPRLPTPAESETSTPDTAQSVLEKERKVLTPVPSTQLDRSFLSSPPTSRSYEQDEDVDATYLEPSAEVGEPSELSHTQRLEQGFQHERDGVIRQIQEANTSQVIVVNSDIDEEQDNSTLDDESGVNVSNQLSVNDNTLADIWQAEADRSLEDSFASRNNRRKRKQSEIEDKTPNLRDLFPEALKPPRAKLPRTWRRTSGNDFLYSDEAETPARSGTIGNATATILLPHSERRTGGIAKSWTSDHNVEEDLEKSNPQSAIRNVLSQSLPSCDFLQSSPPGIVHSTIHHDSDNNIDARNDLGSEKSKSGDENRSALYRKSNFSVVDKSCHDVEENSCTSQSENSSMLQTSDIRQLRTELNASADVSGAITGVEQFRHPPANGSQNKKGVENSLLRPDPSKSYDRLFDDELTQGQSSSKSPFHVTDRGQGPLHATKRVTLPSTKATTGSRVSAAATPRISKPQPTLFSRLASWFHPVTSPAFQFHRPIPSVCPKTWNRNHYLLLDHYWHLSLSPNSANHNGPPLPLAYNSPLVQLPKQLIQHLHHRIHTHGGEYPSRISEQWIRVAWTFMTVAQEEGIPIICDGRLDAQLPLQSAMGITVETVQDEYPKRDEHTGRILRVRETWPAWDVLRRVYALWVRDFAAEESRNVDNGRIKVDGVMTGIVGTV